ncbi:MAG: sorbosone dehydrogenase family protein, partial [Methylobacteriaceae bacterium]|nr:sorbosone dehydrogenase family protein [Methylobacteriaceae bacterium]MBV9246246.1 sorbosone dehydrogenase family protein [Methylobacteriaceae bacterium]
MRSPGFAFAATTALALAVALDATLAAPAPDPLTGAAAYSDWRADAPGVRRKITAADLPAPLASRPAANPSRTVPRPAGALPKVPGGFAVDVFASGLEGPRAVRVAPNGDVFVAESRAGRIRVLRAADGGAAAARKYIFAAGLDRPYGIAFYPPGPEPRYVYVATTSKVVRFPYRDGELEASGSPEAVVPSLPSGGGHWTRDIA